MGVVAASPIGATIMKAALVSGPESASSSDEELASLLEELASLPLDELLSSLPCLMPKASSTTSNAINLSALSALSLNSTEPRHATLSVPGERLESGVNKERSKS